MTSAKGVMKCIAKRLDFNPGRQHYVILACPLEPTLNFYAYCTLIVHIGTFQLNILLQAVLCRT